MTFNTLRPPTVTAVKEGSRLSLNVPFYCALCQARLRQVAEMWSRDRLRTHAVCPPCAEVVAHMMPDERMHLSISVDAGCHYPTAGKRGPAAWLKEYGGRRALVPGFEWPKSRAPRPSAPQAGATAEKHYYGKRGV